MKLHILGICGTFMGGIAQVARELGHEVDGSDANVYPPMSDLLRAQGVRIQEGYQPEHLQPAPDVVVIGNAMSRGNPAIEHVLDRNLPYTSGPQWLAEQVLQQRWVLAVSGTHGKTTTSSILAFILDHAGLNPGFLIGGVPENFGVSARLGAVPYFVIEADEYDTAFFDKRSKFVHYRQKTLIINNLEYDHADIFPDLAAIQRQFHHLVRTVPRSGLVVSAHGIAAIEATLDMGLWTPRQTVGTDGAADWQVRPVAQDFSHFEVWRAGERLGEVRWGMIGKHNALNAVAAIAAAHHAGVAVENACAGLAEFKGVKRRLQQRGVINGIAVYDDFAHHPTAIAVTLEALRQRVDGARIIAVLEPRSNTMRLGVHREDLSQALDLADISLLFEPPQLGWDLHASTSALGDRRYVFKDLDALVSRAAELSQPGDHVVIMSNGGFGGVHEKLMQSLGSG